jgi:hypothetical protein
MLADGRPRAFNSPEAGETEAVCGKVRTEGKGAKAKAKAR